MHKRNLLILLLPLLQQVNAVKKHEQKICAEKALKHPDRVHESISPFGDSAIIYDKALDTGTIRDAVGNKIKIGQEIASPSWATAVNNFLNNLNPLSNLANYGSNWNRYGFSQTRYNPFWNGGFGNPGDSSSLWWLGMNGYNNGKWLRGGCSSPWTGSNNWWNNGSGWNNWWMSPSNCNGGLFYQQQLSLPATFSSGNFGFPGFNNWLNRGKCPRNPYRYDQWNFQFPGQNFPYYQSVPQYGQNGLPFFEEELELLERKHPGHRPCGCSCNGRFFLNGGGAMYPPGVYFEDEWQRKNYDKFMRYQYLLNRFPRLPDWRRRLLWDEMSAIQMQLRYSDYGKSMSRLYELEQKYQALKYQLSEFERMATFAGIEPEVQGILRKQIKHLQKKLMRLERKLWLERQKNEIWRSLLNPDTSPTLRIALRDQLRNTIQMLSQYDQWMAYGSWMNTDWNRHYYKIFSHVADLERMLTSNALTMDSRAMLEQELKYQKKKLKRVEVLRLLEMQMIELRTAIENGSVTGFMRDALINQLQIIQQRIYYYSNPPSLMGNLYREWYALLAQQQALQQLLLQSVNIPGCMLNGLKYQIAHIQWKLQALQARSSILMQMDEIRRILFTENLSYGTRQALEMQYFRLERNLAWITYYGNNPLLNAAYGLGSLLGQGLGAAGRALFGGNGQRGIIPTVAHAAGDIAKDVVNVGKKAISSIGNFFKRL